MAQEVNLSWSDRQYLKPKRNAATGSDIRHQTHGIAAAVSIAAWETSRETRLARETMKSVGISVDAVSDQVEHLEREIGLHLDQQTLVLEQQAELLAQIRDAVLTPAKTRAAERVADAAQLLRRERWERALTVAEEGIEADPNNPGVFFAAGWALVALERPDAATEMFEEARDAADGDERSRGARQAARAALAGGNTSLAYSLARDARQMAESEDERAAVAFDVAVYAHLTGDEETSHDALRSACHHNSRYCQMALVDRNFKDAQHLRDAAAAVLTELSAEIGRLRPQVEQRVARDRQMLPHPPSSQRAYGQLPRALRPTTDWAELRAKVTQDLEQAEALVDACTEKDNLQGSLGSLEAANHTLEEAEANAQQLGNVVAEHDAASQRHEELQSERSQAEADRDLGVKLEAATSLVKRKQVTWIFWTVAFILVGLAVPTLLPIGLLLLVFTAASLIVNEIGAQRRVKATVELERLNSQLS